jgi:hypothetical protein
MTRPAVRVWRDSLSAAIGVGALLAGANFLFSPEDIRNSALGKTYGDTLPHELVLWGWVLTYFVGGILILWGVLRGRMDVEAWGMLGVATVLAIYALALWGVFGRQGMIAIANTLVIVAAVAIRITWLFKESRALDVLER